MIEGDQSFLHNSALYPSVMGNGYQDIQEKIKGKYIHFHTMK